MVRTVGRASTPNDMKIKATYKNLNPFHPDINRLGYSKTVEVPDDTNMDQLKQAAIEDTRNGFRFDKIEKLKK